MSTRAGIRRAVMAAVAIAGLVAGVGAPAAAGAATTDNWWWDTYGIQALHDAGATGAGVKIAVMDDLINPDLPVFAGRNLTVADETICQETASPVSSELTSGSVHGTTVTATIIGTGQGGGAMNGIAPDAEVTFYGLGRPDTSDCTPRFYPDRLSPASAALQQALEDGADIFITSISASDPSVDDAAVIANALAAGMVIVQSTYNPDTARELGAYSGEFTNGVVFASAVDRNGELQTADDGEPLALEGTRVVAAGVDMPTVGRAGGSWDDSGSASGSSFAAPLVAGMIALAAQRYPEATGNQLVQSLIHNTNGTTASDPVADVDSGYGYGAAWPATMLADDATAYPDENPLMDRELGSPKPEQLAAAAARGSAFPPEDAASPSPPDDATDQPEPNPLLPSIGDILAVVLVVLGVVVVAAVITVLIVVTRKKNASRGGTP